MQNTDIDIHIIISEECCGQVYNEGFNGSWCFNSATFGFQLLKCIVIAENPNRLWQRPKKLLRVAQAQWNV